MAITLEQILIDANATLDLEASLPTGDELTLRTNYANQAVRDAVVTGQLSEMTQEYVIASSTLATIPLPANFYEFKHDPMVLDSVGNWHPYPEIGPEEKYDYSSGDRYCYVMGNPREGYNAIFNNLISNATLSIILSRFPTGMATLSDKCELSDPTYVVRSIESYVLYSRGDERFPTAKSEKERQLKNMMGRDMKTAGGQVHTTKSNFRNPLR